MPEMAGRALELLGVPRGSWLPLLPAHPGSSWTPHGSSWLQGNLLASWLPWLPGSFSWLILTKELEYNRSRGQLIKLGKSVFLMAHPSWFLLGSLGGQGPPRRGLLGAIGSTWALGNVPRAPWLLTAVLGSSQLPWLFMAFLAPGTWPLASGSVFAWPLGSSRMASGKIAAWLPPQNSKMASWENSRITLFD